MAGPGSKTARAVCLNCIDGRVQLPAIHWIADHYDIDCVDMITEPGMDGLLSGPDHAVAPVLAKLRISIGKNNASLIFVVGHHDCRGNPVSDGEHQALASAAAARLQKKFPSLTVTALWVDGDWQVNPLAG